VRDGGQNGCSWETVWAWHGWFFCFALFRPCHAGSAVARIFSVVLFHCMKWGDRRDRTSDCASGNAWWLQQAV